MMQQHNNTGNFPWMDGWEGEDSENTVPPTVSKDEIQKHLRNLNIQKSKGPNKIHPGVLKELADVVTEPLSMIFQKSWHSGEVPNKKKNFWEG